MIKFVEFVRDDVRCDCEAKGCHAGNCEVRAYVRVRIHGILTKLCSACLTAARAKG